MRHFHIKPEIRVLGVDDGPHSGSHPVPLVGVVFRGNRWFEGILKTEITKDGMDVTDKLIEMVKTSRQLGQLRIIITDGITFAGFNVLDIRRVFNELGLPVIAVSRTKPNMRDIKKALKNLPDWPRRWDIIRRSGKVYALRPLRGTRPIYVQPMGIDRKTAKQIVEHTRGRSSIPEPVRVAHMVATAIVRGESHGGA